MPEKRKPNCKQRIKEPAFPLVLTTFELYCRRPLTVQDVGGTGFFKPDTHRKIYAEAFFSL